MAEITLVSFNSVRTDEQRLALGEQLVTAAKSNPLLPQEFPDDAEGYGDINHAAAHIEHTAYSSRGKRAMFIMETPDRATPNVRAIGVAALQVMPVRNNILPMAQTGPVRLSFWYEGGQPKGGAVSVGHVVMTKLLAAAKDLSKGRALWMGVLPEDDVKPRILRRQFFAPQGEPRRLNLDGEITVPMHVWATPSR